MTRPQANSGVRPAITQIGGLAPLTKGIGSIEGDDLVVVIPPWLAEKLRIGANSFVVVDNAEGKVRITRSAANDV